MIFNLTLLFNTQYVILTYVISQLYNRNYPVMGCANKFIMREDNSVQCEVYRILASNMFIQIMKQFIPSY